MRSKEAIHAQVIEKLYDGVLTDAGWREALGAISAFTGSPQTSIIVHDPQTSVVAIAEYEDFGIDPATLTAYNDTHNKFDPGNSIAPFLSPGVWYHDLQHVGLSAMQRNPFYQDFLRQHDISTIICNRVLQSNGMEAYLSLQRRPGQPYYEAAELDAFNRTFIPHVQRAVRIRAELKRLAQREGLTSLVLDRLRIPMLVLDDLGTVLKTNAGAEALMRRLPRQLQVRQGRLHPQGIDAAQFERLLQSATGRHGPAEAGGAWLKYAQEDGKEGHAMQCLVLPVPPQASALNPWVRPLALVLLRPLDPQHRLEPQPSLMRQLFDLTLAETRIAMALCQGDTPTDIAQRQGVSVNTVRTHLRAIFAKTGTTRQTDLLRLLSSLLTVDGLG
jgi:DNA-binding CsgD family transcriptional regulator